MVSTLKERPSGGFYCSECRMSTAEPVETCPFCGSVISNWMDVIIKQENDKMRPLMDIDPVTGKNKFAKEMGSKSTNHNAVTIYTPNSKRELERLNYRQIWEDEIRKYLQNSTFCGII